MDNDLISRQATLDAICKAESKQISKDFAYCEDAVNRQAAIDKFIDGLEDIFADLRERHVDDSVCGLCEYDGAYIGQSGDWCNECPGFEKDDCFKLSDKTRKEWTEEIIKALPSAQPEIIRCKDCKYITEHYDTDGNVPYWTCSEWDSGTDYDGFCHYAERRTDDGE